ncbi:hypothetical protein IV498_11575 [Paenarthrobacter sp. Z7-10]|uniref:hypothetical protein n=1 Tax=Paenarthrobacter sp. Z7-10 TaxID=2787635 RepID=UPI0022A93D84|nr:hypothetical protein [Paenarthrobacter sp. Z7-10]MCZ2403807.1 hypothetical protein [Paenarthrobacter sp. Z7-10]
MNEIHYVNSVKLAQENLEEANRQFEHAKRDFAAGDISPERFAQLESLKDTAALDLQRVLREN